MSEDIGVEVLSAAVGGAISASILYPLEVLKTKMQSKEGDEEHEGMIATAERLYENEGPIVFVRGIETSAFQSALEKALYFFAYTALKSTYSAVTGARSISTLPNLVLGCAAEWAHLPVTLPVDAMTTKIQTSSEAPIKVMLSMLQDRDTHFYKGIEAYSLLCLKPALQYTAYEQIKKIWVSARPSKSLSSSEAFLLGMIARTIATVVVFPCLRAKVLVQTSKSEEKVAMKDLLWRIWQRDGLGGLYQGITPELTRGVFSSALMLMIKERLVAWCQALLRHRRGQKQLARR